MISSGPSVLTISEGNQVDFMTFSHEHLARRAVMAVLGVFLSGFAVGFFNCSCFGVDPFQCLAQGIWGLTPLPYGAFYALMNLLMLVAILFTDKHYIGLATCINIFLLGYVVDFSQSLLGRLVPDPALPVRMLFLLTGIVMLCVASAVYFTADLGVSTYDAVALILTDKRGFRFQYCRIVCDLICVGIGLLCGKLPGLGTLITAFFMGPLITFFRVHLAEPMLYGAPRQYAA